MSAWAANTICIRALIVRAECLKREQSCITCSHAAHAPSATGRQYQRNEDWQPIGITRWADFHSDFPRRPSAVGTEIAVSTSILPGDKCTCRTHMGGGLLQRHVQQAHRVGRPGGNCDQIAVRATIHPKADSMKTAKGDSRRMGSPLFRWRLIALEASYPKT